MNALVLGGNGFIGSHLVDLLLEKGHFVRVLDKAKERFRTPLPDVDYRLVPFDDKTELAESLTGIEVVFHLISTTVPGTSSLDPAYDIQSNLITSISLLNLMVKAGIKKIVFLSSGGTVYGDPSITPTPETQLLNPICSYGIVKAAIENYMLMYKKLYQLEPIIIRASNPYGPRQGHFQVQGVISTFLNNIKLNKDLTVWGTGGNVRDYLFINDLVNILYMAGTSTESDIFNAGSGVGTSINELIKIISSITDREPKVNYLTRRGFDVKKIVLDISKTKNTFNWKPETTLESGIIKYWNFLSDL
jgi:UDP-glucose 4-epimerase